MFSFCFFLCIEGAIAPLSDFFSSFYLGYRVTTIAWASRAGPHSHTLRRHRDERHGQSLLGFGELFLSFVLFSAARRSKRIPGRLSIFGIIESHA